MVENEIWITVGNLVAAHGLHGELKVNPCSEFEERFTKPGIRWLQERDEEPREYSLQKGRKLPGKALYIIRLSGVNDRSVAEALVGRKILVQKSNRPKLAENEFHYYDLVGLHVKLLGKEESIGQVTNLITGGNELLEVQLEKGPTVLIPFVKEIVPKVCIKEGWLSIDPPPGLLELHGSTN